MVATIKTGKTNINFMITTSKRVEKIKGKKQHKFDKVVV